MFLFHRQPMKQEETNTKKKWKQGNDETYIPWQSYKTSFWCHIFETEFVLYGNKMAVRWDTSFCCQQQSNTNAHTLSCRLVSLCSLVSPFLSHVSSFSWRWRMLLLLPLWHWRLKIVVFGYKKQKSSKCLNSFDIFFSLFLDHGLTQLLLLLFRVSRGILSADFVLRFLFSNYQGFSSSEKKQQSQMLMKLLAILASLTSFGPFVVCLFWIRIQRLLWHCRHRCLRLATTDALELLKRCGKSKDIFNGGASSL